MFKDNDWNAALRAHRDTVNACGVPKEIIKEEKRFWAFLLHGYDEYAGPNGFEIETLSEAQFDQLLELVCVRLGMEDFREKLLSSWVDTWAKVLKRHHDVVKSMGIPAKFLEDGEKFESLIEGGLNKVHRSNFGLFMLTSEQRQALVVFLRDRLKWDKKHWEPLMLSED